MDIEESIGGSALEAGRGEYMTIQEFADLLRIGRGTAWSLVMERAEEEEDWLVDRSPFR